MCFYVEESESGAVNASRRRQHRPERRCAEVRAHRCRLRVCVCVCVCAGRLVPPRLHHAFIKGRTHTRTAWQILQDVDGHDGGGGLQAEGGGTVVGPAGPGTRYRSLCLRSSDEEDLTFRWSNDCERDCERVCVSVTLNARFSLQVRGRSHWWFWVIRRFCPGSLNDVRDADQLF